MRQEQELQVQERDILINALREELAHLRQLQAQLLRQQDQAQRLQKHYLVLVDDNERTRAEYENRAKKHSTLVQGLKAQTMALNTQAQQLMSQLQIVQDQVQSLKTETQASGSQLKCVSQQLSKFQGRQRDQQNKLDNKLKKLKSQRMRVQKDCVSLSQQLQERLTVLVELGTQLQQSRKGSLDQELKLRESRLQLLREEGRRRREQVESSQLTVHGLEAALKTEEAELHSLEERNRKQREEREGLGRVLAEQTQLTDLLRLRVNQNELLIGVAERELQDLRDRENVLRGQVGSAAGKNRGLLAEARGRQQLLARLLAGQHK